MSEKNRKKHQLPRLYCSSQIAQLFREGRDALVKRPGSVRCPTHIFRVINILLTRGKGMHDTRPRLLLIH